MRLSPRDPFGFSFMIGMRLVTSMLAGMLKRQSGQTGPSNHFFISFLGSQQRLRGRLEDAQKATADVLRLSPEWRDGTRRLHVLEAASLEIPQQESVPLPLG